MNSFKLLTFKRKLVILYPINVIFKLHSRATEGKNGEKWVQKDNFLANEKSLNEFIIKVQSEAKKFRIFFSELLKL